MMSGPCDTSNSGEEDFDQLIEQSSLSTPGARLLRARISRDQVANVRRRLAAAEAKSLQLPRGSQRGEPPETGDTLAASPGVMVSNVVYVHRDRRLDSGDLHQRRVVAAPSEVAQIALVRAVIELYRDELLARAGYRPGVDDADELLEEITLEAAAS